MLWSNEAWWLLLQTSTTLTRRVLKWQWLMGYILVAGTSTNLLISILSVSPLLSHWITGVFFFPFLCQGGQFLSDWRIGATDSLPGVNSRQSSGDPQHLLLFHQLCRGSVGQIWPRLPLISTGSLSFSHLELNVVLMYHQWMCFSAAIIWSTIPPSFIVLCRHW